MGNNALLAGGLLIIIVLVLARLQPAELLHPSPRTQGIAGSIAGLVSVLVLGLVHYAAPEVGMVVYPTATAFMALYFGGLAALLSAAISLAAAALMAPDTAYSALLVVLASAACGLSWRALQRGFQPPVWVAIGGISVTLPLAVTAGVLVGGALVPQSLAQWMQLYHWHHGLGILVLATWRQLVVSKVQSAQQLLHTHAALNTQDQQLRLVLDSLGGGRWEWDVAQRRLSFHGDFYKAFGIDPERTDTDMLWERWYALRHPQDVARNAARLERAKAGLEENYEAEFRVRNAEGQWRLLMTRGTVSQRDAQGRALAMVGMDVDITAHREVEDALRASEAKYTTFYQTLPDPAGISRVADGRYVDVNPAFCEAIGKAREEVIGRTSEELGIWTNGAERAQLMQTFFQHGKVDRMPLAARTRGQHTPGLISARTVTVENQKCFVFVFHDITQAQRTSDELRSMNALLVQAGHLARLGAWEDVPGEGLVYWSDVCFDIHGLAPDAPLPRDYIQRHVAPPYQEAMRTALRRCAHDQLPWSMEMEVLRADGRRVWTRAMGEPVVENGRVVRMRGVMQDIDDAKRAEQRLRHSEERFSRIFHQILYPMGLSQRGTGRYLDINPAWEHMMGISREEAIGRTAIELGLFTPTDRDRLLAAVDGDGQLSGHELTLNVRGGPPRTVLQSMRATDFDGSPCWLFSVQDITDRKREEMQIREREELLSLTLSAASLGLWDWNLQTGTLHGDRRWHALWGHERPRDTRLPMDWRESVSPEDAERINAELARHVAEPATPFDATWRVNQPGDAVRWVRSLGKIVSYDSAERPERMLGVAIDVTPQREQEVLLQRMALYDALTGLPNRVLLARKLQQSLEHARSSQTLLGIAYLDLDGFKPVNDRLGHGAGDRLLVAVAGRLTRTLPAQDTVARLGGDEFVLLLPGMARVEDCEALLQQVMASVSAPYALGGERVVVTASIGFTVFPQDSADPDALLRHADQAMYAAKQAGRNRFHQFDAMQERAQQLQREQGGQVRSALAAGQFELYLQPKVDMRSGAVVGAEALARWNHPERGLVPPGAFLPQLEGTELEIRFGEWVIDTALTLLEQLQAAQRATPISINIAAQHVQHPEFTQWIALCLARHPTVPASLLEVEITESSALYDLDRVAQALRELRALGATVSLDDFGTGYSSLTYLRRLPMDTVKIDQSFVHGMMTDPGDLAIVQGVIGLARSFGYRVIAEGVETVEQGQMLLQLGCAQAQGYCIARPMPLAAFREWSGQWTPPAGWQRSRSV